MSQRLVEKQGIMHYFVGWDTGAWHCDRGNSRDAICIIKKNGNSLEHVGSPWRGNLRSFLDLQGCELVKKLLALCCVTEEKPKHITIAIDAPLGWPEAMRNLINDGQLIEVPESFENNPFLFRKTERCLFERGFSPLSAVQDMIGSQSTKAIYFLNAAGMQCEKVGVWKANFDGCEVTAIETYPAPCHHSEVFREYYEPLKEALLPDIVGRSENWKSDVLDALACSVISYLYSEQREKLKHPCSEVPFHEGWIWIPKDARKR